MKSLEIISTLPKWAKASPAAILDSPAFLMPCRLGDESASLRLADVAPAGAEALALDIAFGDVPHRLLLARTSRFPELDKIWDSRADVPAPVLLALVERECGPLFQMLENAVRRQMRLVGVADAVPEGARLAGLQISGDPGIVFALTRSDVVVSAFGSLRNLDLSHAEIRAEELPAVCEYAAFATVEADLSALAPGDAVIVPEVGTVAPRLVVDGRFVVDANGVSPYVADALVHVRAATGRAVSLGEVFDAVDQPPALAAVEVGAQLQLVKDGRLVASGRLDKLADQLAFVVEG